MYSVSSVLDYLVWRYNIGEKKTNSIICFAKSRGAFLKTLNTFIKSWFCMPVINVFWASSMHGMEK